MTKIVSEKRMGYVLSRKNLNSQIMELEFALEEVRGMRCGMFEIFPLVISTTVVVVLCFFFLCALRVAAGTHSLQSSFCDYSL